MKRLYFILALSFSLLVTGCDNGGSTKDIKGEKNHKDSIFVGDYV